MDVPMYVDRINMDLPILYYKGSQIEIYINDVFLSS